MIEVVIGELGRAEVECILRPVNSMLEPITREGGIVGVHGGDEVLDRLKLTGSMPVGAATITPAGDLDASFMIHAVVQSGEEPCSLRTVRQALINGLRRATEWGIESVALPPLGLTVGNLEPERLAEVMIEELWKYLSNEDEPSSIIIVVANEYEEDVFVQALGQHEGSET